MGSSEGGGGEVGDVEPGVFFAWSGGELGVGGLLLLYILYIVLLQSKF